MIQNTIFLGFLLCVLLRCLTADNPSIYMEDICGQEIEVTAGYVGRVELTKKLQYPNLLTCSVTLVPKKGLKIIFKRFEVEDNCKDWLLVQSSNSQNGPSDWSNVYSGSKLCGSTVPETKVISGGKLLLSFSSDATAGYRGFEMDYIGYMEAPCEENMFVCDKVVCIANQYRCDGITTCDDGTDEKDCTLDEPQTSLRTIIISVSVTGALLLAFIIAVIAYKLYYRKVRREFALQVRRNPELAYKSPEFMASSYPVTDKYRKNYAQMDDEQRYQDFQDDMEYDYYFRQLGRRTAFYNVYSMKNDWEMARNWAKNATKPKGGSKKKADDEAPLPMSPDTSAFSYEGVDNPSLAAAQPESNLSAPTDTNAIEMTMETQEDSK